MLANIEYRGQTDPNGSRSEVGSKQVLTREDILSWF